jgi:hypothetical protein
MRMGSAHRYSGSRLAQVLYAIAVCGLTALCDFGEYGIITSNNQASFILFGCCWPAIWIFWNNAISGIQKGRKRLTVNLAFVFVEVTLLLLVYIAIAISRPR